MARILVMDLGVGFGHAQKLYELGNEVTYYVAWTSPYPEIMKYAIGDGFGLKKTTDYIAEIDNADLIVFTDVGYRSLPDFLRKKLKKKVFGGGDIERLEFDRVWQKEIFRSLGIKFPETKVVQGVSELVKLVQQEGPKVVKVSFFRGDSETFYADSNSIDVIVTNFVYKFGPYARNFKFICEQPIDGVMVGVDTFFNGKRFLKPRFFGIEVDSDVVGAWQERTIFDKILDALRVVLEKVDYRGAFSIEAMMDEKGDLYCIDVCMRFSFPLSMIYTYAIDNYQQVIERVADGQEVDLFVKSKYSVLLNISVGGPMTGWCPIKIEQPEEKSFLLPEPRIQYRLRSPVKVGDVIYHVPGERIAVSLIENGDNYEFLVDKVFELKNYVSVYSGSVSDALYDALSIVDEIKAMGVDF